MLLPAMVMSQDFASAAYATSASMEDASRGRRQRQRQLPDAAARFFFHHAIAAATGFC